MDDQRSPRAATSDRPYLVVSGDAHAGPSLDDLRPYCPAKHVAAFDEFAEEHRRALAAGKGGWSNGSIAVAAKQAGEKLDTDVMPEEVRQAGLALIQKIVENPGSVDVHARLADMDADGVAAEVIFAGAQNRQVLPWAGGIDAGSAVIDPELRAVGGHMWNEWIAEFCSAAPERLLGVAQIPIWNIDDAVREVVWAKEHGLRAINLPAPRPDYEPYNRSAVYQPFWSVVEEVGLPLVTHSASGETASGSTGDGATLVHMSEVHWLSRRGLSQIIFGRVFDRHPNLLVGFVEQRGNWVPHTLEELDSTYLGIPRNGMLPLLGAPVDLPSKTPSEYWRSNCFIAASFMAPFEAAMRHETGIDTLMWGTDYPHLEGTWPRTRLAMRNTFAGIPEPEVRAILGTNGARFYGIDEAALAPLVDRIGPTPAELAQPLAPDEFPIYTGLAFREAGAFH